MNKNKEILPDNPASRLLSILNDAVTVEHTAPSPAGEIWAKVLKVKNIPEEMYPSYAKLFTLTKDAYEKVVHFYPQQEKTHKNWKNLIIQCLQSTSPFHHKWVQVKTQLLTPAILDMLQIAADNLSHYVAPTTVDDLSIEKLKEDFSDIKASILEDTSFSKQLKDFLIAQLENILNYLDQYDLYGTVPIKDAIYNIVSNAELQKNAKPSFAVKLGGFLIFVASTISIINDVAEAPKSLTTLHDTMFLPFIESVIDVEEIPETSVSNNKPSAIKEDDTE